MLVVISPAKRLNLLPVPGVTVTEPEFAGEAAQLAKVARALPAGDLSRLMSISADLGRLNAERFRSFRPKPAPETLHPAALMFDGDTYAGLEARSLEPDAMAHAQGHLRILSGLYGLLRPLDGVQPYRLEMGTRIETPRGTGLYAYWGKRIAKALNAAAEAAGTGVLLNCASEEYFKAVDLTALKLRVVTPRFLEDRPGGPKIVSFFAKKARGAMARFVMERRVADPADLAGFDTGGYAFRPDLSEPDRPVFIRVEAEALAG